MKHVWNEKERNCPSVNVLATNLTRTDPGVRGDNRGANRPNNVPGLLNLLEPTGYVMHHQFNIQQLYDLPTLYLCVLYLSDNKQRLVPLTA